jgi:type IV pilus assembly protein PilO
VNLQDYIDEINTLGAKHPGDWPVWARIGSAVLLAVAVLAAGFWFVIKPEQEILELERGKEPGLFASFEQKQRKVALLDAYKTQLAEMERTFGDMLRVLPARSEVANLLNDISQTRVAASLEEELFKPLPDEAKDFYVVIPNQVIVIGSFHEMGAFVSGVAALPRIVTIEDVDIRPLTDKDKRAAADGGGEALRMQAVAKTYRYLDEEETAAQEAKLAAERKARGGAK